MPQEALQNPIEAELDKAFGKVKSGEQKTVWVNIPNLVIKKTECTLEPVEGQTGVFAIVDHSLMTCVGYTTDKGAIGEEIDTE